MSQISTYVSHGIIIGTASYASPLTITASGSVIADNGVGVYSTDSNPTLVNDGTVAGGIIGTGVLFKAGGSVDNSGLIRGTAGVAIYSAAGTVTNTGTIAANAGVIAGLVGFGVSLASGGYVGNNDTAALIQGGAGAGGSGTNGQTGGVGGIGVALTGGGGIDNAGTIAGGQGGGGGAGSFSSPGGAGGSGATGVNLSGGGSIGNTGRITGGQGGGGALNLSGGHGGAGGAGAFGVSLSGGGTIDNSGTIAGGAGGGGNFGAGSFAANGAGGGGINLSGGGTVINLGAINGGLGGSGSNYGPAGGAGGVGISLSNNGTILNLGAINGGLGGSGGVYGSAGGGVVLADGGVVTNGSQGTAGALISGLIGIQASGATGATVTNYGTIASTSGTSGVAVQFANASSVLTLEGSSALVGTVIGAGGTLNLASAGGAGTVSGFGSQYSGFAHFAVLAGASWTLTGTNTIAGGATLNALGTLLLAGSLDNSGSAYGGLTLISGAQLTNEAGAQIAGSLGSTGADPGGSGGAGGGVGGAGNIGNAGTIVGGQGGKGGFNFSGTGGQGGAGAAGADLSGGGTIDNSGAIAGGQGGTAGDSALYHAGLGGLGGVGVALSGGSSSNTGRIIGGQGGKGGAGSYGGAGASGGAGVSLSGGGTIGNTGTIAGGQGGAGGGATVHNGGDGGNGGDGINLAGGGSIGNTGTIAGGQGGAGGPGNPVDGIGGAAGVGIRLADGGTVTNGSLGATTALIAGRIGIAAYGTDGATIVDYGTISGSGGTAVYFGGTGANRLVLAPGYSLGGIVYGSAGGATNTLELASAASQGTVSAALNTEFVNFHQITVDAGAQWTLAGGGSGVVLSDFGTLTNTGTIAGKVTLAGTAYLNNTGSMYFGAGFVFYTTANTQTVVNSGTISGQFEDGKMLGGVLINTGVMLAAASGPSLYIDGVYLTNGQNGYIGSGGIEQTKADTSTIVNAGTILSNRGPGVTLFGTLNNSGTIISTTTYSSGIVIGLLINSGTMTGGTDAVILGLDNNTLINSGTISGAAYSVITIYSTGGNRVVVDPGAVFNGIVNIGTGSNVLELASAASAGTVSGIGTQYVGFTQVTVDAGAQWTIAGTNTLASGATLTVFGKLTNAGTVAAAAIGVYGVGGTIVNGSSVETATLIAGGGGTTGSAGYYGGLGGAGSSGIFLVAGGSIGNFGTVQGGDGGPGGDGANIGGDGGAGGAGIVLSGAGNVTNYGTVAGGTGGIGGYGAVTDGANGAAGVGIRLTKGGTVTNGSPGTTGALIAGRIGIAAYGTAGATVADYGTISGSGSTAVFFAGTGGNLLALGNGYDLTGAVVGSTALGASDTLELRGQIAAGVIVNYNGLTLTNFEDVLFGTAGYDTLKVSNTGGTLPVTLSGFILTSDTLDLTGIAGGTLANNGTVNGSDQLIVTNGTDTVTLQLDTGDSYTGLIWHTSPDGGGGTNVTTACYCRGTMILTPEGEVAIEDLAIGDSVVTLSGEAKPVKWIGQRAYDGRFVVANRDVLPIRIATGALADGVPARDLLVSPEHSLYFDGVLVAARQLLNGATITQETAVERVEYFHIELDAHDIVFANGAPAESFVDCDNRGKFHNAAEFAALYPEGNHARWQFYAPRLQWDSEEPNPIRAALMQRAEALGHRLDLDPDLHLVVDGAVLRPDSADGHRYRFKVPAGCTAAALASRSAVPAEVWASARDGRRLGVPVERLVLYDADLRIEAGHGHVKLAEGFHEDEISHRWTDGLALLPESWLRSLSGEFTIEVHLIFAELPYRLPPSIPEAATAA